VDHLLDTAISNAFVAGLLGLAAWLVGLVCRRPAVLHALWLLVLLKLITPPLVPVPVSWATAARPAPPAAAVPAVAVEPPVAVDDFALSWQLPPAEEAAPAAAEPRTPLTLVELERAALPSEPAAAGAALPLGGSPAPAGAAGVWPTLRLVLAGVWLGGSAGWLLLLLARTRRFQRLLVHARPAPLALAGQVESLGQRLALRSPPPTLLVPGAVSPMLWGLPGAARLLFPAELLPRLDDEQRGTLLVHELAHLRRRDHWVRVLELLATVLYWWHPVVWCARRGLREAEEQLCDAWVVWALPAAAKSYAIALVETVNFLADAPPPLALPPAASGVGQVPMLKRRLTMIMRGSIPRTLSAAGLCGVLGLGALLLPFVPTLAQADPPAAPDPVRAAAPDPVRGVAIEVGDVLKFKEADAARREQIEKARAEARQLAEEMEKVREQTRQLERRLVEAHHRLAELGGADAKTIIMIRDGLPGVRVPFGLAVPRVAVAGPLGEHERAAVKARMNTRQAEMVQAEAEIDQLRKNLGTLQRVLKETDEGKLAISMLKDALARRENELRVRRAEFAELKASLEAVPRPAAPAAAPQPATDGDRRMQEVERKLQELLREVQGLRQEMHRPGERGRPGDERRPAPPRVEPPALPAPPAPPRGTQN